MDKDFNQESVSRQILYLLSETNNFDISYNTLFSIKNISPLNLKRSHRPENFWETYRKDSIDNRNKTTYITLDSIGGQNVL
jgi:hypothetical protein